MDELGDAAVLAVEFSSPHQARRRRQLMRYSMLSATAIVTTFVMATFYWPAHRDEPNQRAVAQAPKGTVDAGVPGYRGRHPSSRLPVATICGR